MMIRRLLIALLMLLEGVAFAVPADIATAYRWTIEMGKTKTYDIPSFHHGETVVFEATYLNDGVPKDFTAAHLVEFWYRPATWPSGSSFAVITGEVYSATGGVVRARWTSSNEFTNCNNYVYQFVVQSTIAQVMPGGGRFSLLGSLNDGGAGRTNPPTLTEIDWATTHNSNIGSAPFLSSFQVDDLQDQLDTLFEGTGDAHVNSITSDVPYQGSASNLTDFPSYLVRIGDLTPNSVTNVMKGEDEVVARIERSDEHNLVVHFPIVGEGEIATTNRLYWVVNGVAVGYVSTNGITMLHGSLQLYEEDLNCNVRAYDGSKNAPSVTFYGSPTVGWYRKSVGGSYAWAYAHNSNVVAYIDNNGWSLMGTRVYEGYGADLYYLNVDSGVRVANTNGLTTNFTFITSILTNGSGQVTGTVTRTLNICGGVALP